MYSKDEKRRTHGISIKTSFSLQLLSQCSSKILKFNPVCTTYNMIESFKENITILQTMIRK